MIESTAAKDEEHLRLLSIFHYVVAAMAALFSLFPVIHLVIGIYFIVSPPTSGGPPPWFGWIFVIIALFIITMGLTLAGCIFAAGRLIAARRRHTACVILAGVECLFMPLGTVLGAFTISVLMRDSVKQLFH